MPIRKNNEASTQLTMFLKVEEDTCRPCKCHSSRSSSLHRRRRTCECNWAAISTCLENSNTPSPRRTRRYRRGLESTPSSSSSRCRSRGRQILVNGAQGLIDDRSNLLLYWCGDIASPSRQRSGRSEVHDEGYRVCFVSLLHARGCVSYEYGDGSGGCRFLKRRCERKTTIGDSYDWLGVQGCQKVDDGCRYIGNPTWSAGCCSYNVHETYRVGLD